MKKLSKEEDKNAKIRAKHLMIQGYRRTSNSAKMISRIDRHDWKDHMAALHGVEGLKWVDALLTQKGSAENLYRRCYSKDTLVIKPNIFKFIKSSDHDAIGYVHPQTAQGAIKRLTQQYYKELNKKDSLK